MRVWMRLIFAATILATTAACGATATVYTAGQPAIEGRIVGGDTSALYVQNAASEIYRVPKNRVHDVDHPGNVLFTVGAIGFGSIGSAVISQRNSQFARDVGPQLLFYGALALLGGWQWWESSSAASVAPPAGMNILEVPPLQEVR